MAATSPFLYLCSLRTMRSRTGTTNASVLPEPVTAWGLAKGAPHTRVKYYGS